MLEQIFKAYDIRGIYPEKVNEDAAWQIGYGVGAYLGEKRGEAGRVLVSRDMRKSSSSLSHALAEGIRAAGMDVADMGMCDTSMMYFAINHLDAAGGVQTTASHNPAEYNGFKISGPNAKPIGSATGLEDIRGIAEQVEPRSKDPVGKTETIDLWKEYREHILSFLFPLKRKVKVVIDASNGMAGKMVPAVFEGVENLEIVPINFEITGEFAHDPNPLVAENIVPTQEAVRSEGAALGACFDGDADRCMLVDETGQVVGCDHLTALLAKHFIAMDEADPHTSSEPAIVYDLRSSKGVEQTIRELGAKPVRSRVGHVFMKALMRDTDAIFGGELSGHFYFRGNYYADSGAIAFASVLSVLGQSEQSFSDRVAPLRRYPQSGEINFEVEDKQAVMEELGQHYSERATIDELDGVTVDAFDEEGWWFNVRASNTEPLLRLNAEAKDQATLDTLMSELTPRMGEPVKH